MLHRLLACFALLTGLTVAGVPLHARDGGVARASVEQGAATALAEQAAAVLGYASRPTAELPEADLNAPKAEPLVSATSGVELKVDRARE